MATSQIMGSVYNMLDQMIAFLPTLVAVIVLLIVGLIAGKALGKIGAKILDKIGLDDLINKTSIGAMIERTGITTVGLFESTIKWFIYFIFAVIIIDLLQIEVVAAFIAQIILYIPLILSALAVLIIGLLVVDFITNLLKNLLIAAGLDERVEQTSMGAAMKSSNMAPSGVIAGIVKLFGYLIFIIAALDILKLEMIAGIIEAILNYLPNLFAGVLILLIGLLAIDLFADHIGNMMKNVNVEGANIWIPALRGFLSLVIILLALDAMLIDTSIFYILIGPLAWGVAIVVAFKWGIKDALVAYAKEKK
ncbi:mechanosensitive ion channel family protein [Methanolobus sp. WCC5]|uniref:mechanosensitive ion channel family protein n=1 Tax=Methanolobus sp. WCC5 TaxID=3125785 RepID=UPI0032444BA4